MVFRDRGGESYHLRSVKDLYVMYFSAGRVVNLVDGSWVELLHQPNSGRARVGLPDTLVLLLLSGSLDLVKGRNAPEPVSQDVLLHQPM